MVAKRDVFLLFPSVLFAVGKYIHAHHFPAWLLKCFNEIKFHVPRTVGAKKIISFSWIREEEDLFHSCYICT